MGPTSSETARLIESFDWASTSLGALGTWPQSLKTAVSMLLYSPVPIVLLWGEHGVMLYNDAYSVFAGGRHPALLGSRVREGWPEVAAFNDNVMRVGLAGGTLAYEDQELTLYRHGRAEQVWMNLDYSPVMDERGRPAGVLAIVVETTMRVLAERRIKESSERFCAFVTASSNALFRMSPDWAELRELDGRGFLADAEAPRTDWLEAYVHPDDQPLVAAAIEAAVAARSTFDLEHRVRRADGSVGWTHSRAVPILDRGGAVVEWFGAASDVTDRHHAADRLRQSEERQRFLLDLGDRTRGLADPEAVIAATTRALGERLGASRVAFAEIDEAQDLALIRGGWTDGTVDHLPSALRMADFSGPMIDRLRSGRTLRVDDASIDPHTKRNLAALDAIRARAIVSVPLLKDGVLVANLNLHQARPRAWTDAEVDLIEAAAERTWAAVERARSEAALRASEARLRFMSELDEAMRASRDALCAMLAAAELLARSLGASRCAYAVVDADNDRFIIHDDYTVPGLASSAGTYSLDLFGPRAAADMRSGRTLVIRDVAGELAPGEGREMFQAIGIDAIVCCPLVKEGRLVAMMAVHQVQSRGWHPDEVALVETVVERCWAHVERVGAEARLRASEARFRGVFDSKLTGLSIFDARTGETLAINDTFLAMTGHSRADFEEGRWDWRDFTIPDYLPLDETAFAQARERGWWEPYEKEYRRLDGGRFPVRISSAPLAGEPDRVVVSIQDISEARAAEAELRESEKRLQLAKQAAGIGVWDWDLTTNAITWSSEMYQVLGVDPATPPERLFEAWTNVLHPADREAAETVAKESATTGDIFSMDVRVLRDSGEVRWVRSQGMAVRDRDGRPIRLTGINVDVTGQHRLEEELRDRADQLAQTVEERTRERNRVFDLSSELFAAAGFDGYLKTINPAWSKLLGYTEVELLSRPFVELVHPGDHEAAAKVVSELAAGRPVGHFEDRLVRKNGEVVWIAWTAVPEGDRFYAVGRDVTQDRFRDEALRQAQKMEAVGQLTGGVAHDFNNLLTIIKSSTDLLRRPGLADDRRQRYVGAISDTVDRASKLTGQLLAFARRQALKPEVFDAASCIQAIADMLRTIVGSRVQIITHFPEGGCFVEADASQFETAIVNMAVNARDAMYGQGTLTVQVRSAQAMPAIRGHRGGPGPFVAVSLADTGSGIPEDKLVQIFEPFFTTKEVGKGTGLGLSQVYGFAKQSGGDVAADSTVGHGTTFTLYLPRAKGAGAHEAGSAVPAPMVEGGHGQRVLVVEDNEAVGAFSTQVLQDLGYETTWAVNASEALRLLAEVNGFDAVFSDVVMPGMSGIELGQEIRRRYPDLPVVLTSGYSHVLAEEGRHGFELLQKPYAAEELSKVLRRVTRGQRAPSSAAPA
ncbi:PAS domain-containing protein [Methylobacterium iners]|uniref:histidine kinase n=1 Tax=Methylobacterium iners TaxID=418707 RepID=A0ABQ4RUC4_9HYPH|nr:PAS domain-containing protein [Methylobacterium iners]GJD94400.1 Sensor histidine kinase RcsC [Methylobacterium iners]